MTEAERFEVKTFFDDIELVCQKHKMFIAHADDSFVIYRYGVPELQSVSTKTLSHRELLGLLRTKLKNYKLRLKYPSVYQLSYHLSSSAD